MIELIQSYLIASLIVYFFPFLLSLLTRNRTGGVFVMNLFLGWTFIGWVWALIWAVTSEQKIQGNNEVHAEHEIHRESQIQDVDNASLINQLSQLHSLLEKEVISKEIYEQERVEILSRLQKHNVDEMLIQKDKEEAIVPPLEDHNIEYEELFGNRNWFEKNKRPIILIFVILIFGTFIIYLTHSEENHYQTKYEINKIDFYTARGYYDRTSEVLGKVKEFRSFFTINIDSSSEIRQINDTLYFEKKQYIMDNVIRYYVLNNKKIDNDEADLFIDVDPKKNIIIRRYKYTGNGFNDTTKEIYHYTSDKK